MTKLNTPKFIFLLTIFFFSFIVSDAQIIYTDLTDTTITKSTNLPGTLTFAVDINNDNIDDYSLAVHSENVPPTGCTITPNFQTDLSAWIGTMPLYSNLVGDSAGHVALVHFDTIISPSAFTWSSAAQNNLFSKTFTYPSCVWDSLFEGYWYHDTTDYIALKFKVGTQIHYGWIRVRLQNGLDSTNTSYISMTIMDYAFNSAADQSIRAGETSSSSVANNFPELLVQANFNSFSNELIIQSNVTQKLKLTIYNSFGKNLFDKVLNEKNSTINLGEFPDEIYIYRIMINDKIIKAGKFIKN